eukprot:6205367-Pleurochrysis_carterae.AAC.4
MLGALYFCFKRSETDVLNFTQVQLIRTGIGYVTQLGRAVAAADRVCCTMLLLPRGHMLRRAAAAAAAVGASGVTWATGVSGGGAWSHAACSASKDQPQADQTPTQAVSPQQADAAPRSAYVDFLRPSRLLAPVTEAYERAYDYVYDTMIKPYAEPSRDKLLPSLPSHEVPKPTLVISLDGCIIESSWTVIAARPWSLLLPA